MAAQAARLAGQFAAPLLVQHDLVDEAFVFGLPTADGDQSVGCVLVSTVPPNAREALIGDVRAWLAGRAAAYKTPTTVAVLTAAELPLTATGKVSKRLLQERVQAGGSEIGSDGHSPRRGTS